jgi:membrane protein
MPSSTLTEHRSSPTEPLRFHRIAWRSIRAWLGGGALHWGATLAYFGLISLGPVVLLVVGVGGRLLGADRAGNTVVRELEPLLGARAATIAETVLAEGTFPGFGSLAALLSLLLLLVAASAVFANLRAALNTIWFVRPVSGTFRNLLRTRLTAFAMIIAVGGLVLASTVAGALVGVLAPYLEGRLPFGGVLARILELVSSTVVLWVAFAATFRFVSDARIAWRDLWAGALFTAVLFVVGKFLIGLFLAQSNLASLHGAASTLFVFLLWLYYSAQIFLLGATFTREWAYGRGREIVPRDHAARVETRVLDDD